MNSIDISISTVRRILSVGCILIAIFAIIDLRMMPENLHGEYFISRFGFQIPPVLALLAYSFHSSFIRFQQPAILIAISILTYSNYWLIQQSWLEAQFAFSYEGTLLYTFFAFFVLRINFKYGLAYVFISLTGFALLTSSYPIYGIFNSVNLGFVAMAQFICLYGLYTLSGSLNRVDELTTKLAKLSRIDQLSGLFNRRAYEQDGKLLLEQAKRLNVSLCLFMVDIDHFKPYNDTYGHQMGDEAIQIQANVLKNIFKRESDIIGRFGGEEFIIITVNMSDENAQMMAQRILDDTKDAKVPHRNGVDGKFMSCSIGISNILPDDKTTLKQLIGHADEALFEAKSKGRNQYQQYLKVA